LKISQGLKATLFLDDYFQGPAVVLSSNWYNFTAINLLKITTLNIEALCESGCVHGKCTSFNKCECEKGWKGEDCNKVDCANCVYGQCIFTQNGPSCICYQGWEGPSCHLPICFPRCQSGTCISPNVCECKKGFVGIACERLESICGDGFCSKVDENCKNCPEDCGTCPEVIKETPPPNPIHADDNKIKFYYRQVQEQIPEITETERAFFFILLFSIVILMILVLVNRYLNYSKQKIENNPKTSKRHRIKSD